MVSRASVSKRETRASQRSNESKGASVVLFYHYIARLKRDGYIIRHILLLEGDAWGEAEIATYRSELGARERFDIVARNQLAASRSSQ